MSPPICCLADIPIMHLGYHAARYGKIAIGFHRDLAIRVQFSPVFYQLRHSGILQSIYEGIAELENASHVDLESDVQVLADDLNHVEEDSVPDIASMMYDLAGVASVVANAVTSGTESFENLLAFIKTFDTDEFDTIYTEREWRSTKPFAFDHDDISMIVLPRNLDAGDHYKEFVYEAKTIGLPATVSIVAWDDLIEH